MEERNKRRFRTGIALALLAIVFTGCPAPEHRLYKGPKQPADKVATIAARWSPLVGYEVDGIKIYGKVQNESACGNVYGVNGIVRLYALLPGTHVLKAGYYCSESARTSWSSGSYADISFEVKAGHRYRISHRADYGKKEWEVLITDESDRERVTAFGPFPLKFYDSVDAERTRRK